MVSDTSSEWTLTAAARLLAEPEHRLIYLCEKGVVHPSVQDAGGRGSSRRFSARNILEFAVALRLRESEIPASTIAIVIRVLGAFEKSVGKTIRNFRLPDSLRVSKSPDLRTVISDGGRLYFTLRTGRSSPKIYGGLDLHRLSTPDGPRPVSPRKLDRVVAPSRKVSPSEFGHPEGSDHTRIEVSITRIARELRI